MGYPAPEITPPEFTRQGIFDRVWNHFVRDRNAPAVEDGRCVYRSSTGNRCAFGILIPDEEYVPTMEGPIDVVFTVVSKDPARFPTLVRLGKWLEDDSKRDVRGSNMDFVLDLLTAHEDAAFRGMGFSPAIERHLRDIAAIYNLKVN